MKRELRLGECLKASLEFLPQAYARGWAAILLATVPAALLLTRPVVDAAAEFRIRPWQAALAFIALTLTGLVRDGALYRIGVRGPAQASAAGLGPAGLQFGRLEARLLAASLLVTIFMLLVAITGFVVTMFVAAAAGLSEVDWSAVDSLASYMALGDPWRMTAVAAVAASALAIMLMLAVKLSLYAAATTGRARTVSLDALALADGNALKLASGLLVTQLPSLAAWAVTLFGADVLLIRSGGLQLAVAGLVQAPLTIGFLSAAYRALEYVKPTDEEG